MERDAVTVSFRSSRACFVESSLHASIPPRAAAEGLGTMLLMIAISGSAAVAHQFKDPNMAALASAAAISASLVALIIAFGPVSGGHFNPLISFLQWKSGTRRLDCALAYIVAQTTGATLGSIISLAMFDLPPRFASGGIPDPGLILSEFVSAFALMMVVLCCSRNGSRQAGPFAVGAWLCGGILATPTGSLANPAVTIALVASSYGPSPVAVGAFVIAQFLGGLAALLLATFFYPLRDSSNLK
ncbi:aquaporin [Pararhizobium sp. DWP3-4]|uniref:aquaporin n=1 Tax=unclassified Pararhizobium TaxID=2643050 RepID=UPI003CF600CD